MKALQNKLLSTFCWINKLIFDRKDLLEEDVLRSRSGQKFEQQYLRKGFDDKITVLRILDSRNENFKISRAYQHKIDVINYCA